MIPLWFWLTLAVVAWLAMAYLAWACCRMSGLAEDWE